jgi:hypothetical protein
MKRLPMSGKLLQDEIVKLARGKGFRVAHFSPARVGPRDSWITNYAYDTKGFLDLVLVRERLIMAEVKGDGDSLKPEQKVWIEWLNEAGVESYVWRPKHWFDGTIDEVLIRRGYE